MSANGVCDANEQDAQGHQQGCFVLCDEMFYPFNHQVHLLTD
jgi:hypothetical protein